MLPQSDYLRRNQAADYLQSLYGAYTKQTLAKLACVGGGPVFHKMGRIVLYKASDLDAWAASKMSDPIKSTAEWAAR